MPGLTEKANFSVLVLVVFVVRRLETWRDGAKFESSCVCLDAVQTRVLVSEMHRMERATESRQQGILMQSPTVEDSKQNIK